MKYFWYLKEAYKNFNAARFEPLANIASALITKPCGFHDATSNFLYTLYSLFRC